jgi:hypothetical protein
MIKNKTIYLVYSYTSFNTVDMFHNTRTYGKAIFFSKIINQHAGMHFYCHEIKWENMLYEHWLKFYYKLKNTDKMLKPK